MAVLKRHSMTPQEVSATKPSKLYVVRCYTRPHSDGRAIAVCIDLDLAVIRDTVAEARAELEILIAAHIDTAAVNGWPVYRRAPASDQAFYFAIRAVHEARTLLRRAWPERRKRLPTPRAIRMVDTWQPGRLQPA